MSKISTKYIDLISKLKEVIEKEQIELEVEAAENQIVHDLHQAKVKLSLKKKELNQVKAQQPFNTANVIRVARELKLIEKDIEDMTALKAELF